MLPANYLTATSVIAAVKSGERDLVDVIKDHQDRYEDRGEILKAWVNVRHGDALREARQSDNEDGSILRGMTVGVKDIIWTRDLPTEHGASFYRGSQSLVDAAVVELCRMAGATILGKTTTHEFAWGGNVDTVNPFAADRKAGGSSVGSAVAVADYQCHVALGTQTSGSVVRRASNNGVFGFKPTWGVVCLDGVKSLAPSFDTIGILARSVSDIQVLSRELGVIEALPSAVSIAGLNIGMTTLDIFEDTALAGLRNVWNEARNLLTAHGAVIQQIDLGPEFEGWSGIPGQCSAIVRAETHASLLREYKKGGDLLSPMSREPIEQKSDIPNTLLADLYDRLAALRPRFDAIAGHFDAILTPSTPGEAPLVRTHTDHNYAILWTGLHVPMINVPGLCDDHGLPIGLSLVGPRFSDAKVLAVAKAVGDVFVTAHKEKMRKIPGPADAIHLQP